MAIQVTGTLVDPLGNPMEITIRVTAENSQVAVKGSHATVQTAPDGTYNFNLEEGVHLIQILQNNEYTEGTVITVHDGIVSPIDLGTLLDNHEGQI